VAEHGWCCLNAIIDCCTREIVAWQLELRCRADEAIAVVERAATTYGIEPGELVLGSDNGSAFTARRFRARLAELGIRHRRRGYRDPSPLGAEGDGLGDIVGGADAAACQEHQLVPDSLLLEEPVHSRECELDRHGDVLLPDLGRGSCAAVRAVDLMCVFRLA
jgi:hypothetical protein